MTPGTVELLRGYRPRNKKQSNGAGCYAVTRLQTLQMWRVRTLRRVWVHARFS